MILPSWALREGRLVWGVSLRVWLKTKPGGRLRRRVHSYCGQMVAPRPAPGHSCGELPPELRRIFGWRAGRSFAVPGLRASRGSRGVRTRVSILRQTPCPGLSLPAPTRTVLARLPARPIHHRHSSILNGCTTRIPLKGEGWGSENLELNISALNRSPVRKGTAALFSIPAVFIHTIRAQRRGVK